MWGKDVCINFSDPVRTSLSFSYLMSGCPLCGGKTWRNLHLFLTGFSFFFLLLSSLKIHRLGEAATNLQNAYQNWTKRYPLIHNPAVETPFGSTRKTNIMWVFNTMSIGRSWSWKTWTIKNLSACLAVGSPGNGIKWTNKQSTMVKMHVSSSTCKAIDKGAGVVLLAYRVKKNGPAPTYLSALVRPHTTPHYLWYSNTARLVPSFLWEE